jgi:hypothetical protein
MSSILEVKGQIYSSHLSDFQICNHCGIVDRERKRKMGGYICPICNKSDNYGHLYYHMGVHNLVDLIQEAYNYKQIISEDEDDETIFKSDSKAHYLSIVIFFITLRELLLQIFIDELIIIKNIPESIYNRLLADNRNYSQKQNKILPALLNLSWDEAIKIANEQDQINYIALNDLLIKAVDARNKFLHEGTQYSITKELGEECILNISSLLNLYVSFHNDYVHPYYLQKII